jgi:predicted lysophospholipase L1 biosynthesis ABC-type transport system permease subunit
MPWIRQPGQFRIVGIAANVKQIQVDEVEIPDVYVPFAQRPAPRFELLARTTTPAAQAIDTLRDRAVPVTGVTTFDQRVAESLRGNRFNLLLVSWCAGLALLLAAAAVYGAVANHVHQRTAEFGIRLALGARPLTLVADSMWRTARIAIAGGILGLAGTFLLAAVIGNALYTVQGSHEGVLYGVTTTEPAILAMAFTGLIAIALVAGAVPARLVTRVDPVRALRSE